MTTKQNQDKLGKTLWAIADELRGAMNADDFRDYMLSFLFLRYLSDNYEGSVKKELGSDYPKLEKEEVSTAKPEKKIDLQEVNQKLIDIEKKAAKSAKAHNQFLKELGLKPI